MDYWPLRRRVPVFSLCLGALVIAGIGALGWWTFFGPGGNYRRFRLRVLMDGAAPGHTFRRGADLAGTSFAELTIRGAVFPAVTLRRADFSQARLRGATFTQCDLERVDFKHAELVGATLTECSLVGADLRGADLSGADLKGSNLSYALMAHARLQEADIADVNLAGAVGLSVAELRRCRNWHKAHYDETTAANIQNGIPLAELQALGFASWELWLKERQQVVLSRRDGAAPSVD